MATKEVKRMKVMNVVMDWMVLRSLKLCYKIFAPSLATVINGSIFLPK